MLKGTVTYRKALSFYIYSEHFESRFVQRDLKVRVIALDSTVIQCLQVMVMVYLQVCEYRDFYFVHPSVTT